MHVLTGTGPKGSAKNYQMANLLLHIGSNLGDRMAHLATAREKIEERIGTIRSASSLYRTAPWGLTEQPDFINQALWVVTNLPPQSCLKHIQEIEAQAGRERRQPWGPRTLDIDLLFYDDLVFQQSDLTLPHPWLHQRRFVLEPLREIAADLEHPILLRTVQELFEACPDTSAVEKLG